MPIEEHYFDCPLIQQTVTVVITLERKHMGLSPVRLFQSCSGILTCGSDQHEPYSVFTSPEACPLREHLDG
ncbi:MAG TPA: hypothetical protein VN436_03860 [Holophaga sp.]|nr:hypothetical protein [Holophaga sp.]